MFVQLNLYLFLSFASFFWLSWLGPFCFIAPKHFSIIWLSNLSILSIPDEGYFRNVSCALNLISMLFFFFVYCLTTFVLTWMCLMSYFISNNMPFPISLKHTSVEVALNSPPLWEAIDRYWRCINDSLSSTSHLILMVFLNTTELSLIDPKSLDK